MDATDQSLLREFAARRCETSFRQLVDRHLAMVFAVSERVTNDRGTAEEIAQTTFAKLAEKAPTVDRDTVVAGWLYHTARNLAMMAVRSEVRRRQREQIAAAMNTDINEPGPNLVAEHLESAMDQLKPEDRDALVLRYFEDRNLRDVGHELGLSEDAARMRVNRALEKLRGIFGKIGIAGSAAWLVVTLPASASAAVPVGLGASITAAVLSGTAVAAAATAAVVSQTTSSTMNLLNLKVASAVIAAAAVTGTSTYLVKERQADRLRTDYQALNLSQDKLAADQQRALTTIQLRDEQIEQLKRETTDLARLRGEVDRLNRDLAAKTTVTAENDRLRTQLERLQNQLVATGQANQEAARQAEQFAFEKEKVRRISDLKHWALALRIDANDHAGEYTRSLDAGTLQKILVTAGGEYRLSDGFDPRDYEQVYFGNLGETDGNTILIRQREPLIDPDGKRMKVYALVDGSVQQVAESLVGSFEQFERNWTVNHQPIPFVITKPR